ncbi:MAG: thioredoxin domain-containing protein, partial [Granulosicoccaceae bacterium]
MSIKMSKEVFVFEVSEKSFGQSVLLNSHKLPVLVEFMGVWSEPCVVMADMLAGLAKEFAEQFIFARVDIDENPALREEYKIDNVPTLIVFRNGEAVRTEIGQLQEAEARALLKEYGVFRESDEIREQARAKHMAGRTPEAITLLAGAVKKDPT